MKRNDIESGGCLHAGTQPKPAVHLDLAAGASNARRGVVGAGQEDLQKADANRQVEDVDGGVHMV